MLSENPTQLFSTSATVPSKRLALLRAARGLMDSWFGAILGGAVYGAWAVWANWADGANQALKVGLAHWTTSALLTFFGTMTMRFFYGLAHGAAGGLRAMVGGLCLTYATLLLVHGLIGTQHVLLTLAPGLIPNVLFCTSYALLLMRTQPLKAFA